MALEDDSTKEDRKALEEFLADSGCLDRLSKWTRGFNAFDVLGIARAEIRHSNVLAWLMDPAENHGLDDGVIRGFVDYAARGIGGDGVFDDLLMDCDGFSIRREWHCIDILAVNYDAGYVLCIENKIFSGEHDDQLARYCGEVEKAYPAYRRRFIFLTPDARDASTASDAEDWLAMGYGDVLGIIGQAVEAHGPAPAQAQFISEYMDAVRRDILGDEELERICMKIYKKHKRALDLIINCKNDLIPRINEHCKEWARRKAKADEIVFDEGDCGKRITRFRTKLMSLILPDGDGPNSSWKTCCNYFYEIKVQDGDDGPEIRCQLCFDSCGLDGKRMEIYDRISRSIPCLETWSNGKNWWHIHWIWPDAGKSFQLVPADFDEEWLNKQLDDMLGRLKEFERGLSEEKWVKDLLAGKGAAERA